jgi:hypothetical protein
MTDPEIQRAFDRWAAREMQTCGALIHREPMFTVNSLTSAMQVGPGAFSLGLRHPLRSDAPNS